MILKVLGAEVGTPNRSKIDKKNELMMGRHLGIDFSWILMDLGRQVGPMLGSKIDPKSIQKAIEKQMRKKKAKKSEKIHATR